MKLGILYIFFFLGTWIQNKSILCAEQENSRPLYKNTSRSFVNWKNIEYENWHDFNLWRQKNDNNEEINLDWELRLKEIHLNEFVGRVLSCVGTCKLYRGRGHFNTHYKTRIYEGDEIQTEKDAYLWIYLVNGGMLRLSPESSITFNEVNISKEDLFYYFRLNYGNMLILSRTKSLYEEKEMKETDALFLPLPMFEVQDISQVKKLDENDLYAFLEVEENNLHQTQKLNAFIKKNNEKIIHDRKTKMFIVMPNGTIFGENLNIEFISLLSGKSYVKQRNLTDFSFLEDFEESPVTFFYRGKDNEEEYTLEKNQWYEISENGRYISSFQDVSSTFHFSELLTKRIPSILTAREILFENDSSFLYFQKNTSQKELAEKYGYRLWNYQKDTEINDRVKFLTYFTRVVETDNLGRLQLYQKSLELRGEKFGESSFDSKYIERAMIYYSSQKKEENGLQGIFEVKTEGRRKLWLILYGQK